MKREKRLPCRIRIHPLRRLRRGVLFYDPIHEIEYYSSDRVVTVPTVPDDDEDRVFVAVRSPKRYPSYRDTYERTTSGAGFRPGRASSSPDSALYNSNAVPVNTALSLSLFTVIGRFRNERHHRLECDHGLVRILDPQPQRRTLSAQRKQSSGFLWSKDSEDSFTFVIDGSVPSGSELCRSPHQTMRMESPSRRRSR